jgi:hypothetical protein
MNDDDNDDDGWGITDDDKTTSIKSSKSVEQMAEELRPLQQKPNAQIQASSQVQKQQIKNSQGQGQDRDLFIPIFAVVSLAGLFGSYGYEMLRLYLRGELYLPWTTTDPFP